MRPETQTNHVRHFGPFACQFRAGAIEPDTRTVSIFSWLAGVFPASAPAWETENPPTRLLKNYGEPARCRQARENTDIFHCSFLIQDLAPRFYNDRAGTLTPAGNRAGGQRAAAYFIFSERMQDDNHCES